MKILKKYKIILLAALSVTTATSCEDYLESNSSSTPYGEFIFSDVETAQAALLSAYETFRAESYVHSNGLFYDVVVAGSDIEHHPETFSAQTRHIPEYFYPGGTENFSISTYNAKTTWFACYKIIYICNELINAVKEQELFHDALENKSITRLTDLCGQAIALRATCYFELCRFIGDVPYIKNNANGHVHSAESPRDYIYEDILNDLIEIEPVMYRVGEGGRSPSLMSRTYVQGLIGRIALFAGGYATRRTDLGADFYVDIDGNTIDFETIGQDQTTKSFYARRSDWSKFYKIAETYLQSCMNNPGSVSLQTVDPRTIGTAGQSFANPFQYVFQMMMQGDGVYSSESIYEITETTGLPSDRPYSFGRPSGGASANAYPCKSYGQCRFQAAYYYGAFHNKDMRRDVTISVTSSNGKGAEIINSWTPGSRQYGGPALNKWDSNRMTDPWTQTQRNDGINTPYMRLADVILMLGEVKAALGNDAIALNCLRKVHNRAFSSTAHANEAYEYLKANSKTGNTMIDYILEERKLEFGGEGMRRWDLIRTAKLGIALKNNRAEMNELVNDLSAKGFHTFPNGNTISETIYTKAVSGNDYCGYRLTTQCLDETDPVLFPGWRGQNNDWELEARQVGDASFSAAKLSNLAIKGLFTTIDQNEAELLLSEGYTRVAWGSDIVKYRSDYADNLFSGYSDADADANKPPIYLLPLAEQELITSGITNGYGLPQK
ncbi:MAG: RagB/SusD family nutrient uptake outer membrane protein [Mangrovibacterium sp.]